MINLQTIIKQLRTKLNELQVNQVRDLLEINDELKEIANFSDFIEGLWIGGWGKENFNHYYDPENRENAFKVKPEYFYELLSKQYQIDIYEVDREIKELLDVLKAFQQEIITDLSIVRDHEKLSGEIELLDTIEKFTWGYEINDYVSYRTPKNIAITDMSILNRGLQIPPHLIATGYIVSLATKSFSPKKFMELSNRILRQIELKLNIQELSDSSNFSDVILKNLFDNFHSFHKQLKNRHANRNTIEIFDEYDVQDLLHSILKLHFRDVREEEYTPSYAGSSTRMDFLLKNEKIVIEVKKTRDKLKDKEIGEQLILDVAHYRNHPDCITLYCFVYDPENRVKNPKGLEDDINKLSNEEMRVNLFIRP